jgi:hypothetical protein
MDSSNNTNTTSSGGGTHWKEQDECQECGADRNEVALRAIKLKSGGRDLLCIGCFSEALEEGRVDPSDPRVDDNGMMNAGIPNAPGQTPHKMEDSHAE